MSTYSRSVPQIGALSYVPSNFDASPLKKKPFTSQGPIRLVAKSNFQAAAAQFDVRFESVAASEARGQLRVSDIDSAVKLYTRRERPVRLYSAETKHIRSPSVPLGSHIRPNSAAVPAKSAPSAKALLSQPWLSV